MATLDLGKIKFVWKGAYDAGTTYEADDVVSYLGSSYIYKNATSAAGNLPTNSTYWDPLAQGTDLSSLSTGAVAYKTSTGVAGVTSANAGDLLSSGGTGVAPSYVAASTVAKKSESVKKLSFRGNKGQFGYYKTSLITNDNEICVVGDNQFGSNGISTYSPHGNYYRTINLPDGKVPEQVYDIRHRKFVITTDNCLYACGTNDVTECGVGLTYGGGRNSTSPVGIAENIHTLTRVEFPTVNYPLTGNSTTPQIVAAFAPSFAYREYSYREFRNDGNLNYGPYAGSATGNTGYNNFYSDGVTFAVDTNGYLWAWGYNKNWDANNNPMGLGWGDNGNQGQNYQYCPVRVPTFLPSTVPATAGGVGFSQPAGLAATTSAIKVVKVEGCKAADGFAALVDKNTMPNYDTTDRLNLYYWGPNQSSMFPGTAGIPTALTKSALGLAANSTDYVRDVVIQNTLAAGSATGYCTIYILLNSGQIWTRGYNAHGQCADGTTTNVTAAYKSIAAPSGLTWAVPPLWDLTTASTYRTSIQQLGTTLVANQGAVFAQLSNGTWKCWGYNPVGNLGRGNADTSNYTSIQDFNLYHNDYPRTGQTVATTGGTDYGQSINLASQGLTTASGTYINKVVIAGSGGAMTTWVSVVTPSTNTIRFFSAGYNYYGQCGNVQAYSFVPFWGTGSYSWAGITKYWWNYNTQFRLVPTNAQFTYSNVLDWDLCGDGNSQCVARVLLATGELYACGYSGDTTVDTTADNNKNTQYEYANDNYMGFSGVGPAIGLQNSGGGFYCRMRNVSTPRLTRVALGH